MAWERVYEAERRRRVADLPGVIDAERRAQEMLVEVLLAAAPRIQRDWQHATEVLPHWIEIPPKQRGRGPTGQGVPWLEVAERVPLAHITAELARRYGDEVSFPGLPAGGDLRFALDDWFVHFDAKAAGPNDLHDEVVVPPYQVSGDGQLVQQALAPNYSLRNGAIQFAGRRTRTRMYEFHPLLPPLYAYDDGAVRLCITAFVKVVYTVRSLGDQPLTHMTLAIVPNGLLLFDGGLAGAAGLFARGKDDASKPVEDHRVRVKFAGLVGLAPWRVVLLAPDNRGVWSATEGAW